MTRFFSLVLSRWLFPLCVLFSAGCASQLEQESPGLANKGILPLSSTDAFLGSNVFLAREMEHSTYLHNFIKTKGGPSAIEITEGLDEVPHMIMFYPRLKEVYAAERLGRKVPGRKFPIVDWVIRGPFQIEREDYRALMGMELSIQADPVFFMGGKQVRFLPDREPPPSPLQQVVAALPPTPPPTPTPKPKQIEKRVTKVAEEAGEKLPTELDSKNFKPLNSDQMAIFMSKGYAERAENGDIIHTVQRPDETVSLVSRWYTGSDKAVAEIAKMNSVGLKDPLVVGARIRVPLAMIKHAKTMPLDFK